MEDYYKHVNEECKFSLCLCNADNCKYVDIKVKMENHVEVCSYFLKPCKWCHFKFKSSELDTHL